MRSFSVEFSIGTMDWLRSKPLSLFQVIGGKFLAAFSLVLIALLPTLVYLFSVRWLAMDNAPLDSGGIAGAYIGLLLLAASFTAIGIFCSSITENQIISFLAALFLCFIFYNGFEAFSHIAAFRGGADYYLAMLGMDYHYTGLSRGLIDTRDLIYFLSLVALVLGLTRFSLAKTGS
jgi:ABC-2 type transport system permease protein